MTDPVRKLGLDRGEHWHNIGAMQAARAFAVSALVAVAGLVWWSGLAADAADRGGSQTPKPAPGAKPQADYDLGIKYLNGDGVQRDETKGAALIRRAAEAGLAQAQHLLGLCYALGNGVPPDYPEAVKWWRKAADQGDDGAQWCLGGAYEKGEGVDKDQAEAVKWWRKAADQGNALAQFELGVAYMKGQGVAKDEAEAVKWWRKAADRGNDWAQGNLGLAYMKGEGVVKDEAEAVKWFRKAADQGNAEAEFKLGISYELGRGVPRDDVEAYKWFNLASACGYEKAGPLRDELGRTMTREEIVEAQRRSAAFVPRKAGPKAERGGWPMEALLSPREPRASATGFFVTGDGCLLTCAHVVKDASAIVVQTKGGRLPARILRVDAANDLALLKVAGSVKPLALAQSRAVKLGESVFTVGFPNVGLQGTQPKLTKGEISGLSGAQDDPRHFQISVAVQPGNSGGPLVSEGGVVIGVVQAKLSALAALQTSGALPENVNYAVKSAYVLPLLESAPEVAGKLPEAPVAKRRPWDEVVKDAEEAVALVLVY